MPSGALLDFWLGGWGAADQSAVVDAPAMVLGLTMPSPTISVAVEAAIHVGGPLDEIRTVRVGEAMVLRLAMPAPTVSVDNPRPRTAVRTRPRPAPAPEPTPEVVSVKVAAPVQLLRLELPVPTLSIGRTRVQEEEDALQVLDLL